jgi:type II secretory pathway pseudopilin PulG
MRTSGFTLIELVVIIVVVAIAIPALLNTWAGISWRSMNSEFIADADIYLRELMEEIKVKRFDEVTSRPWTASSLFASGRSDETEEVNNRTRFDDIDDYNGYADSTGGFNRSVNVSYVNLTGSNWQDVAGPTDFKRVRVSVDRARNAISVSTATIISGY